jgi:O-antigen ligase
VTETAPPLARTAPVTILTAYALILLLIPSQYAISSLGAAGTPAGVLAVLYFLWYGFAWLSPRSVVARERQPLRLAIAAFLIAVLLSYVMAMTRPLQVLELNGADRGLIIVVGWAGIALLTADCVERVDSLEILHRRMSTIGGLLGIVGITQFFTGLDLARYVRIPGLVQQVHIFSSVPRDEFNRPAGTAIHPIEFGVVLGLLLPLAIHGARYAPDGRRGIRWAQVIIIAAAMMMTVSRSAVLAAFIALVVILPTWEKSARRRAYAVIMCFGVVLYFLTPGLLGTMKSLITHIGNDSSTNYRTHDYDAAAHYFSQNPWFGRGFGTFLPQFYRIFDNQYLVTLVEMGLTGLIALIALFGTGWWLAREARKASDDPRVRHLAQCLAACVAVAAFSFAVFDAASFPMTCGLTFLILGCCGAIWRLLRPLPRAGPAVAARSEPTGSTR